jgi:hypothetical protein
MWLLNCYMEMLGRLQSEESLAQLALLQAGGGRHVEDKDLKAYVRDLERRARGGWEPKAPRLKNFGSLAKLGIKVERVPKGGDG